MYEKIYRMEGQKPVEAMTKLLTETRSRHDRFKVTLGDPPFERDSLNKITGIRLRFVRDAEPAR
jgi:hypothetical protein